MININNYTINHFGTVYAPPPWEVTVFEKRGCFADTIRIEYSQLPDTVFTKTYGNTLCWYYPDMESLSSALQRTCNNLIARFEQEGMLTLAVDKQLWTHYEQLNNYLTTTPLHKLPR